MCRVCRSLPVVGSEVDERVLDRRRFDDRAETVQEVEQLPADGCVLVPTRRHRDEVGAEHQGLVHEHPDPHPAPARLVARAAHELVADDDGQPVQRGVVAFLDRHEERVRVDVQDGRTDRQRVGQDEPRELGHAGPDVDSHGRDVTRRAPAVREAVSRSGHR